MGTPYAIRAYESWVVRSRRAWRSTLTLAVVGPLLFLGAMGTGLGALITGNQPESLGGVTYGDFIAPGLLAGAAMQVAVSESLWPVHGALTWDRSYHAMVASPLRAADVFHGHLLMMVTHLALDATAYTLAAALLGFHVGWLGLLAIPAAAFMGLAICAPLAAWAVGRKQDTTFAVAQRVIVMPMFLFSGTFFPLELLPGWLQGVVWATPLWHGVDLCRSLMSGDVGLVRALVHVGYLGALAGVGLLAGRRTYAKALLK